MKTRKHKTPSSPLEKKRFRSDCTLSFLFLWGMLEKGIPAVSRSLSHTNSRSLLNSTRHADWGFHGWPSKHVSHAQRGSFPRWRRTATRALSENTRVGLKKTSIMFIVMQLTAGVASPLSEGSWATDEHLVEAVVSSQRHRGAVLHLEIRRG